MTNEQIKYFDSIRGDCPNRFPMGTKFKRRGRKHPRIETVIDFITSTNLRGEIVNTRYITEHEMCGQIVTDTDVSASTIAMGELLP